MATFLDATLLSGFSAIFAFLLVFAVIYGVLNATKIFGLTNGLAAIIAFSISFLTMFSPAAMQVIRVTTPWYAVLFFLVLMFLVAGFMLGGPENGIKGAFGDHYPVAVIWIIILCIIIFLAGLGQVFLSPDNAISSDSDDIVEQRPYFLDILLHPKIIGIGAVLAIAVLSIYFMGRLV